MRRLIFVLLLLTGAAVAQTTHSVVLACNDTQAGVVFNFFRSTVSGGPYSQINPSAQLTCGFTDTQVTNGTTYFYVANAFDMVTYSSYSNEAKAVIPLAPVPPVSLTATVK